MKLFDVYPLFDIEVEKANGCYIFDKHGNKYLDLYGGHAVISIGHAHPEYVKNLTRQLERLGFYSNSVKNPLQQQLATQLGKLSGYDNYSLFLVNSGAEANENALKLASFHTGRSKIVAFNQSFHGRTSAAVQVTDNPKIAARINHGMEVEFCPLNDVATVQKVLDQRNVCAVIIEGIQGVGGVKIPNDKFLRMLREKCTETETVLILDEIQSGYGRSGKFFAHQYAEVKPDIITVAKGMGNGFPIGGVLVSPLFKAVHGMLGTTFGGNHLACAAAISVLEVMEKEHLIANSASMGKYLKDELKRIVGIKELRGRGLMIGVEMDKPIAELRKKLLYDHHIFVGASGKYTLRLLPPLSLSKADADLFLEKFESILK